MSRVETPFHPKYFFLAKESILFLLFSHLYPSWSLSSFFVDPSVDDVHCNLLKNTSRSCHTWVAETCFKQVFFFSVTETFFNWFVSVDFPSKMLPMSWRLLVQMTPCFKSILKKWMDPWLLIIGSVTSIIFKFIFLSFGVHFSRFKLFVLSAVNFTAALNIFHFFSLCSSLSLSHPRVESVCSRLNHFLEKKMFKNSILDYFIQVMWRSPLPPFPNVLFISTLLPHE